MRKTIISFTILIIFFSTIVARAQFSSSNMGIIMNSNNTQAPPYVGATKIYPDIVPELAGEGVELFNFSMNPFGHTTTSYWPRVYSKFRFNGLSDIGIDSGMVLSTGLVCMPHLAITNGPYCGVAWPATFNSTGYNAGTYMWNLGHHADRFTQYAELVALNNNDSIMDPVILEFDFVPQGHYISLQYVFASEEYPKNACKTPNDVMGIFLSKKGVAGYQNIALLPGTNIPVGVNTINMAPNGMQVGNICEITPDSTLYVDNLGNNGQNVIYDGFTKVLTAIAQVNPCDTYHLKIGVADGARHDDDTLSIVNLKLSMYDSGIFIKARSIKSKDSVWVDALGGVNGVAYTPYAVRGCLSAKYRVRRMEPTAVPLTVYYTLTGNAVSGADYQPLSGTATIPANEWYVDIPVTALTNSTGTRNLKLMLLNPYNTVCNPQPIHLDSATLYIYDHLKADILTPDTLICQGCGFTIQVDGDAGLNYTWTPTTGLNNANIMTPYTNPTETTTYTMTAAPPIGNACPSVSETVTISIGDVSIKGGALLANYLRISPNPFYGYFQIKTQQQYENRHYHCRITDITGREMLYLQGTIPSINHLLAERCRILSSGIYLVNITDKDNGSVSNFKVIKSTM